MEQYLNRGGDSSVAAYESGNDFIRVEFNDGCVYLYNCESAGSRNIEQMKLLAKRGEGLNAFINTNAKHLYAVKER